MAEAFQDFTEALKTIGPCMVSNNSYKETLWKLIMDVFKNEHPCQDEIIDEDEMTNEDEMSSSANSSSSSSNVEEEDQTEYEAMLVSAAADAVCAFALVLGAQFAEPYSHFHPHIVKHLKPTKNTSEKSMAIGTLSEVSLGLGAAVAPYSDEFMSIFFAGLSDEADEVRSNSAYGLGVLIDKSPKDFTPQFMQILQKLHPLFSVASSLSNIRDNACGAVCRMITKAGHAVPLQSVLPVLLASLPLKKDYDENEPIYECLVSLLETKTELFNLQQIMQLFGQVLAPPKEQLGDKTRKRIVEVSEWGGTDSDTMVPSFF